jgi:hypothetical protein
MDGPNILARSMSQLSVVDKAGNHWQYHSRSDQHSKVACWALLFDLLSNCPQLVKHIEEGKAGFGINHEMRDFKNNRKKNLDLVICTPGSVEPRESISFRDLVKRYQIKLTAQEKTQLAELPELKRVSVGMVHLALEAKAAMTEHVKALPRLFDELNSSHLAIHGSVETAIAAGFAIVNYAATFVSTDRNKALRGDEPAVITTHNQPKATVRTIEKLKEIPRRSHIGVDGFDALGIVVIELKNDGSPVTILSGPPAPAPGDVWYYDQMIRRIASLYASRFVNV